uniref:Peroxiredoxin n=1 Tax=Vitiosangium cumulatum TaxID=1867796 RepID=A0A7D5BG82_9BACT|nr:peroxiredoxin [Vitiosangium cumulatum]
MTTWIAGMLTVALLTASSTPTTEPRVGPMDATLRDSDGKEVALSRWRGKPVILFYEDRHSTTLNSPFKQALFARGEELGLLDAAWVVAVANLESFNFFPARGIALSHVRDEEKKWGIPILVDLKGTLGKAPWNLPRKTSSVLLLDGNGTIVYRYSGRMEDEDMETFFHTLGALLGRDLPAGAPP